MSKDTKKEKMNQNEQKSNFIKEVNMELKKVTWPTGKELVSSTATVLFITVLIACIVFCFDFIFEKGNMYGVEKLKTIVSNDDEENDSEVVEGESESNGDVEDEENTDMLPTVDATTEEELPTDDDSSTTVTPEEVPNSEIVETDTNEAQ